MSFFHKVLTQPRTPLLLVSLFLTALIAACAGPTQVTLAQPPIQSGCQIFPADNIWNVPINNLPVDHTYDSFINSTNRGLHPDFGSGTDQNGVMYGIPFVTVPSNQAGVPVTFDIADESDPGPGGWTDPPSNTTTNYPIPTNVPLNNLIEGGPNSGGDQHVLVIQQTTCKLYETWDSRPQNNNPSSWLAGSGAIFDLNSNALRQDTWTSADAAGLPIFPGLARYSEAHAGAINHALRFTVSCAYGKVWPARHVTSGCNASMPPMGKRFRLKASYVIPSNFSTETKAILQALKTYGMMVADNGSNWYISGEPNASWIDDTLVSELGQVQAINFEAVNTSSLMINSNSGQAAVPPTAAPTGLTATTISQSQINLSWTNNAVNQGGFYIERSTGPTGSFTRIKTIVGNTTTYSDSTGLVGGTPYYYRVQAYNAYGTSAYSSSANATTTFLAPTNLTFTNIQTNQLTVNWTDNSNGETGFAIERSPTGLTGSWIQVGTAPANAAGGATTYQDTNLLDATTYYYRVRAYNSYGNSGYTGVANATTQLAPPVAPSGLITWATSSTQINLLWSHNLRHVDSFLIERSPTGLAGSWTQVGTVNSPNTAYSDTTGLTANTPYYYQVKAHNTAGDSSPSNIANAITTVWQVSFSPDNGLGDTDNTLSKAATNAIAGQTILFTTNVSFSASWTPNIAPGVILAGSCNSNTGPAFTINGSNLSSSFVLNQNTLIGLKLQGFPGSITNQPQVRNTGTGNRLVCVVVSKS